MDLQGLVAVLWRRKWILIIVPFLAVCVAFAVRFLGEWKYVSTAQLATGLTVSDELLKEDGGLNPYEVQVTFNNLTEIMRSRSVIGQVSYRLMMHDLADSSASFRKFDKGKLGKNYLPGMEAQFPKLRAVLQKKIDSLTLLSNADPSQKTLQTLIDSYGYDYESLLKNLQSYRLNQSDFIEVTYTSENAALSAFVVNHLCSEFIRYYTNARQSSSSVSFESLETIAQQRKKHLDDKMEELKNFKTSNNLNTGAGADQKAEQIKDYEDQIAEAQQKIRGLELTLANLNVRIENAEISSGLKPNDHIITLRKQINAMNDRYVQGNQTNSALLDSLTGLRRLLDDAMAKASTTPKVTSAELNALKNKREETRVELEIARENLSSLDRIYSSLRYNMKDIANNQALLDAMEKEVEVASKEHLDAQDRLNDAREKLMTDRVSIKQVLVAEPAEKAQSRKTLIFMLFSGVLSFSLCAFVIVAIELTDSRIKTAARFKQKTRLKLAGNLPLIQGKEQEQDWNSIFAANGKNLGASEEIRKIRFEIVNQKAKVLMVSSLKTQQGKSFFIVALAYSLSLIRKRTLIIDTNLRNNSLTRMLLADPNLKLLIENFAKNTKLLRGAGGNGNGNGHAGDEQLNETQPIDSNLVSRTTNELIDIIGNKKSQGSPSEILPGADFKVLIDWLKVEYDFIILEGPALNSYSDTKELTRYVDMVVPVFSADAVIDGKDTESLNYLKSLQEKLGPAVLNRVQENVQ
jgi:succinoglycan biosynthesis transport protein ExoP